MTPFEKLTLVIALISTVFALGSLIVSVVSLVKTNANTKNALDKSEIQNMIAMGNLELSISERISNSKDKVGDITMIISPLLGKKNSTGLSPDEELTLEAQTKVLNAAIENNLNAYEDACSKYLDSKVDTVRFKKSYHTEIRQLVESPQLTIYFNPLTSKFKAILKTYNEWNNLEQ